MTRDPIIVEGKGWRWLFNDSTGMGEIQVDAGVLTDKAVDIALDGEDAQMFNNSKPGEHGSRIQHHWKVLQAKRANRSR